MNKDKNIQSVIEEYAECLIYCSVSGGKMCNYFVGLLSDYQPNSTVEIKPKWKSVSQSTGTILYYGRNSSDGDYSQFDWASLMSSDSQHERDRLIVQSSSIIADFLQGVCDDIHNSAEKCKEWLLEKLSSLKIDSLDLLYQKEFSHDNRITILSGILSFVHATFEFHRSVAESLTPLSIYPSIDEMFNDNGRLASYLRQSAIVWIALSKENSIVYDGYGLKPSDLKYINKPYIFQIPIDKPNKKRINQNLDSLLQKYVKALHDAPIKLAKMPSCFFFCPTILERILQFRCNAIEYQSIENSIHLWTKVQNENLLTEELATINLIIGDTKFNAEFKDSSDNRLSKLKSKISLTEEMIKEALGKRWSAFSKETIESASIQLLKLTCPSISGHASRIAALILFGKSNLVSIRRSPLACDHLDCEITLVGDCISVEVPYIWWITEDSNQFSAPLSRNSDINSTQPLVILHTTYYLSVQINDIFTFSFMFLPKIEVKLYEKSLHDEPKHGVLNKLSVILPFRKS